MGVIHGSGNGLSAVANSAELIGRLRERLQNHDSAASLRGVTVLQPAGGAADALLEIHWTDVEVAQANLGFVKSALQEIGVDAEHANWEVYTSQSR